MVRIPLLMHCISVFMHLKASELLVSHNNFGKDGICSIARSFSKYICKLDISYSKIGNEGCKAIAEALQHCVNLREICISGNQIFGAGAKSFAKALIHCTDLCKLDMSCNYIGNDGVKAIADALTNCTQLEELALNHNLFGKMELAR